VTKKKTKLKFLIILLGLTSPISTDMCLPALPSIAEYFGVSYATTNLIIILFFFFMAASMLLSGPLSDRYGRKKILIGCLCLFSMANFACALSADMMMLIVARSLAACGAGGMMTSSTALIKDSFEGREREKTLAVVQAFHIVGPLTAPIIGAILITFTTWHSSFIVLGIVGAVGVAFTLSEKRVKVATENSENTLVQTFGRMGSILKNKGFTLLLCVAGLTQACFMAYLATSSYIYTVEFDLSETSYSLFFAGSALCAMLGPRIYLKASGKFVPRKIYTVCLSVITLGSILVLTLGSFAPWSFFLCFVWLHIANSTSRPLITGLLLEQHEGDAGTLSSLVNFGMYIIGLSGMLIASTLNLGSYVFALGVTVLVLSVLSLFVFTLLMSSNVVVKGARSLEKE